MIPRSSLVQLGKLIAHDLEHGHVSDGLPAVGDALAADPKAMLTLIDLVAKEGAKKKPDDRLTAAYAVLLGQGLEVLRYGVERTQAEAVVAVTTIKERLRSLARTGKLEPAAMLMLMRQFVAARLTLDDDLQTQMCELMEQALPVSMASGAMASALAELAELVAEYDGDVFAIHGQLAEQGATFPESHRAGMVAALLGSPEPALREAAIGWLLDAGPSTRHDATGLLEQAATSGAVSGTMLRRMIGLRNWLPEAERPALDAVVKACRLKGVECAPLPAAGKIVEAMASGIDGSGAQSLFLLVKDGRKHAVASLLLKQGIGVRDAWVQRGMTKAQAERMLDQIAFQIELFDVSMDYLDLALGHALSVNATSGTLPPFGLVDFLEMLGRAAANPEPLPLDALLERLIGHIPARMRGTASVKRALKAGNRWPEEYGFLSSWFEDGGDLDALMGGKKRAPRQQYCMVLDTYLPPRRSHWAERLAWVALMLHASPDKNPDWSDFALAAHEVAGARPLAEIPVMTMVAATTAEFLAARH